MREDKRRTRWTEINQPYEEAVRAYAGRLVDPGNTAFLDDFRRTARPFIAAGIVNSLAQTLLKLTAPGVPDIYNGAEYWDFSFVDPDNRRPVDFDARALSIGRAASWPGRVEDLVGGGVKQHLIASRLEGEERERRSLCRGRLSARRRHRGEGRARHRVPAPSWSQRGARRRCRGWCLASSTG